MLNTNKQSPVDENCRNDMKKLPLKRFDVAFHKCAQVAIPMHLNLLEKHSSNITKFESLSEWDKVHREQVNASRTVQQLTADIWEIERLRNQIRTEDLIEFDKKLSPLKTETLNAIQAFLSEHRDVGKPVSFSKPKDLYIEENIDEEEEIRIDKADLIESEVCSSKSVKSSWKTLYNELLSLNKLIHQFSNAAKDQQPEVDQIQNNLETTEDNVHQGTQHLTKAVGYKTVLYPLTGALIGCCAGPVGLMIGFKVGIAAAIGGGVLGYAGGKYIKKKTKTF
uniref:t-SNARE coiled-coil homology domain-containing protein n=1 Tax=Strigamia maritima TaxID=126957 RepID=T1IPI1_STRMM